MPGVEIRPLAEEQLDKADDVFRVAFGSFLGMSEPQQFGGDSDFVRTRWRADPAAALAATVDGELVGSNFATSWGSVGFFGPLTVAPERWDQGVARRLLDATMELFDSWQTRHVGLFTFAQSPKHVALYQRYGFWPRFITAAMSKSVDPGLSTPPARRMSDVAGNQRAAAMRDIAELTDAVHPGLDISREVEAVATQGLGDTVLLDDASGLQGVAVCHVGAGSEAGSGACYVKVGAVRPGPDVERRFTLLVQACEGFAAERGATRLAAGVNAGRERAWRSLVAGGFRSDFQGVTMHRPNEPGYSTPGTFLIDDWR